MATTKKSAPKRTLTGRSKLRKGLAKSAKRNATIRGGVARKGGKSGSGGRGH